MDYLKCNMRQYKGKRRHSLKEGDFKSNCCDLDEESSTNKLAATNYAFKDKHSVDMVSEAPFSHKTQTSSNDTALWTTQMVDLRTTCISSISATSTKGSGGGLLS